MKTYVGRNVTAEAGALGRRDEELKRLHERLKDITSTIISCVNTTQSYLSSPNISHLSTQQSLLASLDQDKAHWQRFVKYALSVNSLSIDPESVTEFKGDWSKAEKMLAGMQIKLSTHLRKLGVDGNSILWDVFGEAQKVMWDSFFRSSTEGRNSEAKLKEVIRAQDSRINKLQETLAGIEKDYSNALLKIKICEETIAKLKRDTPTQITSPSGSPVAPRHVSSRYSPVPGPAIPKSPAYDPFSSKSSSGTPSRMRFSESEDFHTLRSRLSQPQSAIHHLKVTDFSGLQEELDQVMKERDDLRNMLKTRVRESSPLKKEPIQEKSLEALLKLEKERSQAFYRALKQKERECGEMHGGDRINNAGKEVEPGKEEIDRFRKEISESKQREIKAETALLQAQTEIQKCRKELKVTAVQNAHLLAEKVRIEKEIVGKDEIIARKEDEIKEKIGEFESLSQKMDILKKKLDQVSDEKEKLAEKNRVLRENIEQTRAEAASLSQVTVDFDRFSSELLAAKENAKNAIAGISEEIIKKYEKVTQEILSQQSSLDSALRQIQTLNHLTKATSLRAEERLTAAMQENQRLKATAGELQSKYEILKAKDADCSKLLLEISEKDARIEALGQKFSKADKETSEKLAKSQEEIAKLEAKCLNLQSELSSSQSQLHGQTEKYDSLHRQLLQQTSATETIGKTMNEERSTNKASIANLKEQVRKLKADLASSELKLEEKEYTIEQLHRQQSEAATHITESQESKSVIDALTKNLSESNEQVAYLKSQITALCEELSITKAKSSDLAGELSSKTKTIASEIFDLTQEYESKIGGLMKENEELADKYEALMQKFNSLRAELKAKSGEVGSVSQKIEGEKKELIAEIERQKKENAMLRGSAEETKTKMKEMESGLRTSEKLKAEFSADLKLLKIEYESLEKSKFSDIAALSSTVEQLKNAQEVDRNRASEAISALESRNSILETTVSDLRTRHDANITENNSLHMNEIRRIEANHEKAMKIVQNSWESRLKSIENELKTAYEQISACESHEKQLISSLESKETVCHTLEADYLSLQKRLKDMVEMCSKPGSQGSDKESMLCLLESEIEQRQRTVSELSTENEHLRKSEISLTEELAGLKKTIEIVTSEREGLAAHLRSDQHDLTMKVADNRKLGESVSNLTRLLQENTDEKDKLSKAIDALQQTEVRLREEMSKLEKDSEGKISESHQRCDTLESQLRSVTLEKDKLAKALAEGNNRISDAQSGIDQLDSQVKSLIAERDSLKCSLNEALQKHLTFETDISTHKSALRQAEKSIDDLKAEKAALKGSIEHEKSQMQSELQVMAEILKSTADKNEKMVEEQEDLRNEVRILKEKVAMLTSLEQQLSENLKVTQSNLASKVSEHQQALASISNVNRLLQEKSAEIDTFKDQSRQREKQLQDEQSDLEKDLSSQIKGLNQRCSALEKQLRENSAEKDKLSKELSDSQSSVDRLNSQIKAMTEQRDSLLENLTETSAKRSTSESIVRQYENAVEGLKKEIATLREESEREKSQMSLEMRVLEEKLREAKENYDKLMRENEQKSEDLQRAIEELKEHEAAWKRENDNYRAQAESVREELSRAKELILSISNEKDKLTTETAKLRSDIQTIQTSENRLTTSLHSAQQDLNTKTSEHRSVIADLTQQLHDKTAAIVQSEKDISLLQERLQEEHNHSEKSLSESAHRCSLLESQIAQKENQLTDYQRSVSDVESKLAKSQAELDRLRMSFAAIEKERNSLLLQLKDASASVSQTESSMYISLSKKEKEIEELKSELETMKVNAEIEKSDYINELQSAEKRLSERETVLVDQKRKLSLEIEALTENVNLAKETIKDLSEKLSSSETTENQLKASLLESERNLANVTTQKLEIETSLQNALSLIQKSKDELSLTLDRISKLHEQDLMQISQLSKDKSTLITDISTMKSTLDSERNTLISVQTENAELQSRLREAEANIGMKSEECKHLSEKCSNMMLEISEITNKCTTQLGIIDSLSEELHASTARNATYDRTISDLNTEIARLQAENSKLKEDISVLEERIPDTSQVFDLPEVVMKPEDLRPIHEMDLAAAGLDSSGFVEEEPEFPLIITSKSQTGELRLINDPTLTIENSIRNAMDTLDFDWMEIEVQGRCQAMFSRLEELLSKIEAVRRKIKTEARSENKEAQRVPQLIGTICIAVEYQSNQWVLEKVGTDFVWKERLPTMETNLVPVVLSENLLNQVQTLSTQLREKTIQMDESEELHLLKTQEYDKIKQMLSERGFNFQGQTLLSVVSSALLARKRGPAHRKKPSPSHPRAGGSNEFSDLALGSESGVSLDSGALRRPNQTAPHPESSNHSSDSMALSESEASSLFSTIDKLRRENDDLLRTIDDYERQLNLIKQKMREKEELASEPVSGTELSTVIQNLFEVLPIQ